MAGQGSIALYAVLALLVSSVFSFLLFGFLARMDGWKEYGIPWSACAQQAGV